MRLWPVVTLMVALLAVCSLAAAGEPPVPIEGALLVTGTDSLWVPFAYYMEGSTDNVVPVSWVPTDGFTVVSPRQDQLAYDDGVWDWEQKWNIRTHIYRADLDGSHAANLTEPAGLGGINCFPQWSPDASQILFQHCDPQVGELPCGTGYHVWVMNADGTGARQITPEQGWQAKWAPNGHRLLFFSWDVWSAVAMDVDGTHRTPLPGVGGGPTWSPDGSRIASTTSERATVGGEPGKQLRLVVTDIADLTTQVLVERFVTDAAVAQHQATHGGETEDIFAWAGPIYPAWSPDGDQIAFLGALLFDPASPVNVWCQSEAWIYDLGTADLTRITSDSDGDFWLDWRGYNTSSSHPEVTVDNTTVGFPSVAGDGLTTIILEDDPPAMPIGFTSYGEYYEISTTLPDGSYSLPITITMTYKDEEVPGGDEGALVLLHYNEATAQWEDITTERNTDENWVRGETWSLSVFGFGLRLPVWVSPLQNGASQGSPVGPFKRGRTIPVKFRLNGADGQPLSDAQAAALHPELHVSYGVPCAEGTPADPGDAVPDLGAEFRYDAAEDLFIYNLSTKDAAWVADYTYGLEVLVDGAKVGEVYFSLR